MQLSTIQRLLGVLLTIFSLSMVPPILVSWAYDDGAAAGRAVSGLTPGKANGAQSRPN